MKGGEGAKAADFANYFCSYAYLYHQKQMLTDQTRMHAYHKAVTKNPEIFAGKTVVDVGTGSGILSAWCAMAGAEKVWAVEFTNMANHAATLVQSNGLSDRVTVVKGAIEELDLPAGSVDVMISEWMGYFLLRESMLDSLIRARNRLLKPGGVMMPSSATMLWAPIECEAARLQKEQELAESMRDWTEFTVDTARRYGVNMACLTEAYSKEQRDYFSFSSQWTELTGSQVLSVPVTVKHLDLYRCRR
jgi:protein arginine N-methyltransferase 1